MKVCPECKRTAANDSNFCSFCGSKVAPLVAEKPQYTTLHLSPSFAQSKKRTSSNTSFKIFLISLCVLPAIVFIVCICSGYIKTYRSPVTVTSRPESSSSFSSLSSSSSSDSFLPSSVLFEIDALIKSDASERNLNIVETEYFPSSKTYVITILPQSDLSDLASLVLQEKSYSYSKETLVKKGWQNERSIITSACSSYRYYFKQAGYKDINVNINVLNEKNTNLVLLSALNGSIVYDCTEE